MKAINRYVFCIILVGISLTLLQDSVTAQPPGRSRSSRSAENDKLTTGIAWFGMLKDGLAEAKETGKPILLVSAAPQCTGVPGIW